MRRRALTWREKKRRRERINKTMAHVFLVLGSIVFMFPFVWLFSSSLKTDAQIFVFPPQIIPRPVVWENYPKMLDYLPFFHFLRNTAYVTTMTIIGVSLSCSLVAYGFARFRFPGHDVLFILLLSTMMVPYPVTMVPLYLVFRSLRWIDTLKPLWVPAFFGWPFYVFLLRQFIMTLPREIEDAAKIDGCSYFRIYWQIILPLIKPALAAVIIFAFMGAWNDFIGPLIYLNSTEKLTLSVGLNLFKSQHAGEWALMMAASSFMVIPVVAVFFFTQRYFIQGITLTGLKG